MPIKLPPLPDLPEMPPLPSEPLPSAVQREGHTFTRFANSETALKIRSFIYKSLSLISKPFDSSTSDYYHFRMTRVDAKLANIRNENRLESIFYGHRMPGGMNYLQKSAAENQAAIVEGKQQFSQKLLEELQKSHPHSQLNKTPMKEIFTEGICFGIMTDLAVHYLNGDNMEPIFSALNSGGSAEAEIYQGAIHGVNATVTNDFLVNEIYSTIEEIRTSDSTLSKVLPQVNKEAQSFLRNSIFSLSTMDNTIQPLVEKFNEFIKEEPSLTLSYVTAKAFLSIKNDDRNNRIDMNNGREILNFPYAKEKIMKELDVVFQEKISSATPEQKNLLIKERERLIGDIKLACAAAEYNITGAISTDPLLKVFFENHDLDVKKKALLSLKGLSLAPCTEIMGSHLQFRDDAGYLDNLDHLDPGFYLLQIKLKNGGHAVSFIKEEDGSGYLIDPNNRKLKFSNDKEAKELANALASTYSQPEAIVPGHPYHKLALFKIEKK